EKSFHTILIIICGLVDADAKQQLLQSPQIPIVDKAKSYSAALQVIEDLDSGLHQYLTDYRSRQVREEHYGFEAEFGILYSKWLLQYWNKPEFSFVHEAFNNYLYTEFVPYDGITNSKWLQMYPEFWKRSDFISVE